MSSTVDGERGASDVAGTKKSRLTPKVKAFGISILVAVVLLLIFILDSGRAHKADQARQVAISIGQSVAYDPPKLPAMPPAATVPPLPPLAVQASQQQPLPAPAPYGQAVVPAAASAAKKEKGQRVLTFNTSAPSSTAGDNQTGGAAAQGAGREASTNVVYKGTQIVGAEAGRAIDRSLVLMPGLIRCILDTAIDSTLPGPLLCHLPAPVISDGGVTLMDKGTQVVGQYTNQVNQGQGRLMAASATAYTPQGVPVPLGGPFADGLGRTGLDGNVDNHLIERFGGAVLLSLTDNAFNFAQASVSKGNNSYVSFNSGGGVGSLAQQVLNNTINIPPTITKNQGDEISIWVLTPIDFSKAYRLTPAGRGGAY